MPRSLLVFLWLTGTSLFVSSSQPTNLHAQATDASIFGQVRSADGEPLPNVTITVRNQAAGFERRQVTEANGQFSFPQLPLGGPYVVMVEHVGHRTETRTGIELSLGDRVRADFELAAATIALDALVVSIGTRRTDRTVLESPVPIDVLSSRDLAQTGLVQTAEIIQALIPSFNQPRVVRGDGTESVRPASMRGLGSDQMLVLVNGRRRHVNAHLMGEETGVDLNAIPAEAIQRIEVLRDGASAQYGSDAIAGVINIVLKEDAGTRISATTGRTTRGDGTTLRTSINQGFSIGDQGFINFTGELLSTEQVRRAGPDRRQQYFGTVRDSLGNVLYSDPVGDSLNVLWDADPQITMLEGDPQRLAGGLFFNTELPVRPDLRLYSFGGASRRFVRNGSCRFREPKADGTVRGLHPNGFLARGENYTTDLSGIVGARGNAAGGTWDLSAGYGGNTFEYNLRNSNNPSMGLESPKDFYLGTHTFQQISTNLDYFRTANIGLPVSLAVGAELRGENYRIRAGEPTSWMDGGVPILDGPNAGRRAPAGSQCYVGYRPTNEVDTWRNNVAFYTDVESNLTRDLLVGAAGRFENYSDFGSTLNGKIALRYEPIRGYAIRGAANTGFRAPSMHQSYFSQTQTNFAFDPEKNEVVSRENRTFPLDSEGARALGASPLTPETSISYSAGLTARPARNLSLSVDYFDIAVRDRIVRTSLFSVNNPRVRELFESRDIRDISAGRFFTNAIDTRTQGWDVVLHSMFDLGSAGWTQLTASYNATNNEVLSTAKTPPELTGLEESIFNEARKRAFARSFPTRNLSLTLNHDVSHFSIMLRNFRSGKWVGGQEEEIEGVNVTPAMWYTDLDVAYRFDAGATRGFTFAVGGTNIFDTMPPDAKPEASFGGNFRYVNGANGAFGVNGSYLYARITYQP